MKNRNVKTNELNCRKHIANIVGADASACPKKHRGITLIALIITIIVMLILVGVTVSIAINGGLFGMAKDATKQIEEAQKDEQALASGKVKIGDLWYDSIEDYMEGIASEWVETEEGITNGRVILQIGDYVNYNPTNVTLTKESEVIQHLKEFSGYKEGVEEEKITKEYNTENQITQEELKWRVLDVKDGKLRLISSEATNFTVCLYGYNGYNNAVYLLDELCNVLYSGDNGTTAKNLKIEDIEDKITYDYTQYEQSIDEPTEKYGGVKEYTDLEYIYYPEIFKRESIGWVDGKQIKEYGLSEQTELIKQNSSQKANTSIKITQTRWDKEIKENDWKKNIYQQIFMQNTKQLNYWISSRCSINNSKSGGFLVRCVYSGNLGAAYLYGADNGASPFYKSIRPVVSLGDEVQINNQEDGIWQLN